MAGVMCLAALALTALTAQAAHRDPAAVPPTLEIEVLDPGVDPLGNPAVFVRPGKDGQMEVDIPPVVLVHRYYYSGDRSFQAQLLPGGPSIVVANHPKTGQRCYVPVQMMPGAPRVTYTKSCIDYDYGEHGIAVTFGLIGKPKVKYRNGLPVHRKIGKALHADHWKQHGEVVHERAHAIASYSKTMACGAAADACDTTEQILLPVRNLVGVLPLGPVLFSTDWTERWVKRAAEHRREKDLHYFEHERRLDEMSIRTIR
jgi:hypothetical protein